VVLLSLDFAVGLVVVAVSIASFSPLPVDCCYYNGFKL